MEEEKKAKYITLKNGMYDILNQTNDTIDLFESLLSEMKNNFLIDDDIVYSDRFNNNLDLLKDVYDSVNKTIYSIDNKL